MREPIEHYVRKKPPQHGEASQRKQRAQRRDQRHQQALAVSRNLHTVGKARKIVSKDTDHTSTPVVALQPQSKRLDDEYGVFCCCHPIRIKEPVNKDFALTGGPVDGEQPA